ncbi:hypothetical protein [Paenarthrobacter nitroguajacolicus]|uniref:hypothetical protein n=1 Tax=Paenarthrobacter nitroguajacolicus TaxID=211146 RepID=UPI002118E784|nr:hypothetical protein [Paenarthrobacter nitroguajacolicus]
MGGTVGARAAAACSLDLVAMDGGGTAGPVRWDIGAGGLVLDVEGCVVPPLSAHAVRAADARPAIPSSTDRRPANGRRLESPMDVPIWFVAMWL